jgi:tetratricopeptide (TPR) repeat protein
MLLAWPSVVLFYARHCLWPVGLSEFYPTPPVRMSFREFGIPLALVLGGGVLIAGVVRWLRWSRAARCGLALLVLPLLPALYLPGLTAGDMLHDRYLYLPVAGFAILLATAVTQVANGMGSRGAAFRWTFAGVLAAAYLAATLAQQSQWASDRLLYTRGVASAPDNNTVRDNLANTYVAAGLYKRALPIYLEVLRRDPNFWRSNYNLAFLYYKTGHYPEAESYFKQAIQIDPSDGDEFVYLGVIEMRQGKLDEAMLYANHAVELNPRAFGYHYVLGEILKAKGLQPEAATEFRIELKQNPRNASAAQELKGMEQWK